MHSLRGTTFVPGKSRRAICWPEANALVLDMPKPDRHRDAPEGKTLGLRAGVGSRRGGEHTAQTREGVLIGAPQHTAQHNDRPSRLFGRPDNGETCDACGASITKEQMDIEGIALAAGGGRPMQLHANWFQIWETERRKLPRVTDRRRNHVRLSHAVERPPRRSPS